ncbi:MAG: hypothetical protein ACREXP_32065 [Steroidobacteraceae bacterium]
MAQSTSVDTQALRAVCERLLDHLERTVGASVDLDADYFWSIEPAARFDMESEPSSFTIGQLSDCWTNVQSMDDDSILSYGLVWLAEILRTIGEKVVR